ncbi:MAG: VTT domain-containing protein [Pseudomonadota bacterium]
MIAALQDSLAWVQHHPHWALCLLFAAALLDALFVVGAFVPAGVALFAAGALVALGSLELWEAVLAATAGAVAGDGFSFWLGRRYGERLFRGRLQLRYPELLLNGRRFLARNGAYSVALARFLGPVRAIVPALAGAAGMRVVAFVFADVAAATVWAFAFVLPGVAFGASLGLAAEVAGRLAMLLVALLGVVALAVWLTAAIGRAAQRHAEDWIGGLLDWSRRHRRLGKFGAALADPDQPETPVLVLLAVVLLALSGLWLWIWAGSELHSYPAAFDAAVFQWMRDLHSPWGFALAQHLLQLGEWIVYGPVALIAFACLLGLGKPRAAAHWIAAVAFGALLSAGLHAVPTIVPPFEFFDTHRPRAPVVRDLVLVTVIYGFLPVLLSTGASARRRRALYAAAVAILTLIVLARLYVGLQWTSVAAFSVLVGCVWVGLLGLGYRRHRPEHLPAHKLIPPLLLAFAVSLALAWTAPQPGFAEASAAARVIDAQQWRATGWAQLPRQRIDIAGRDQQPLSLQWADELPAIEAALARAGWTRPPKLSGSNLLRWLTHDTPVAELPVLPQVHAGQHPALTLHRVLDGERADLLRLWPSRLRLADGRPVWLGSLTRVQARSLYRLLRYPLGTAIGLEPDQVFRAVDGLDVDRRDEVWLLSLAAASTSH